MTINRHYWKRYLRFIEWCDAQEWAPGTYLEKHHIMPRCLGGNNEKDNIIALPFQAHVLAHWMLAKSKITYKLNYAFNITVNCKKSFVSLKTIELAKLSQSLAMTGVNSHRFGKKHSEKTKNKMRLAYINGTEEVKNRRKAAAKNRRNPKISNNADRTIYHFLNSNGVEECTESHLICKKYGLNLQAFRGKLFSNSCRFSYKGWRYACLIR